MVVIVISSSSASCIITIYIPKKQDRSGQRYVLLGSGPVGDNDLWHHHLGRFSPFLGSGPKGDDVLWNRGVNFFRPSIRPVP